MQTLSYIYETLLPPLLSPLHPTFPIAPIDLFGALRLSSVVDWNARGVFDPPPPLDQEPSAAIKLSEKGSLKKAVDVGKASRGRASALQECFGILVVVFGGETFLALCTHSSPSWLLSPKIPLLFCLTHLLQTRTPLRRLLPETPSLPLELLITFPDAIGRTLLLTKFSILPILHTTSSHTLPATPTTLLLTPFTLAVPFSSLIFTTTSFFSPKPTLSTPAELKDDGWMLVDFWIPIVLPILFLTLIGPVGGWPWGLGGIKQSAGNGWGRLGEGEAMVLCFGVCWAVFVMKVIYNLGSTREAWIRMLGLRGKAGKIKTL